MSKKPKILISIPTLFVFLLACPSTLAENLPSTQKYVLLETHAGEPSAEFSLPYSLGTHHGKASKVSGSVAFDLQNPKAISGSLKLAVADLKSGNSTRDCHLQEALSLDYSKSKYPLNHVCNEDDKVVELEALAYPDIEFKPRSLQVKDKKIVGVVGDWLIHGVVKEAQIGLDFSAEPSGFRIQGHSPISLKEHNVVVKSAKIAFVKISVEDLAQVKLDLHFKVQP